MAIGFDRSDVLVVGAGPTGLVLALWLKRLGLDVRILDKTAEPGTTSRALVVHARTLELYRQLGVAEDMVKMGLPFSAVNLWVRGKQVARAALGDLGRGLTPFPSMLIVPQDQHERLLIDHLRRVGVEVERQTELVAFDDRGDRIVARTRAPDGAEVTREAAYLVGCDGAHSRTREVLGIGFPGGTYQRMFYVADVQLRGPVDNHELHLALDDADFLAVFPMNGEHAARIIGTVKRDAEGQHALTWDDVSGHAAQRIGIIVDRLNWFSTYRVHHRVAETFGRGRTFLAGDAAHIHSPVGGQGMNTGIGDASNLAWKLAAVVRGRANPKILESYQPERIAFARRLVATTDRAFTFVSRDGALARLVRLKLVPLAVPALLNGRAARRMMFRILSQTQLNYRKSPLSVGRAGHVRGGDRLPWVAGAKQDGADNFTPLTSLDWQLHVYGEASLALQAAAAAHSLPVHTFRWTAEVAGAGLLQNAAYLVRPDGYVGLADRDARPETLHQYLEDRIRQR
ncbi:MAG TPA: FAD-dependent monooxygenase [Polyangia bacterium]|nr:FAD-dependent monooxygenase [Polyangia bacterium]